MRFALILSGFVYGVTSRSVIYISREAKSVYVHKCFVVGKSVGGKSLLPVPPFLVLSMRN